MPENRMSNRNTVRGINRFKRKYPEFWSYFECDPELDPHKKLRFKKHLKSFKGGDITEHAKTFFHLPENQFCGRAVVISDEILGFVRAKDSLTDRILQLKKWSTARLNEFLRDWSLIENPQTLRKLLSIFADMTITEFTMWSYRNEADNHNPFTGVNLPDLPCRLGLESFIDGSEHYAFGHSLPVDIEAKRPTCFDSDLSDFWITGGRTKPHKQCANKYSTGLPELVHRPNKFQNITTNLMKCIK